MSRGRYNQLVQNELETRKEGSHVPEPEDPYWTHHPPPFQRLSLIALWTIAVSGLALCGLMFAILSRPSYECDCRQTDLAHPLPLGTHTAQYGNDIRYMSLEHRCDHLWESEMSGKDQLIRLNWDQPDEAPTWSTRGM